MIFIDSPEIKFKFDMHLEKKKINSGMDTTTTLLFIYRIYVFYISMCKLSLDLTFYIFLEVVYVFVRTLSTFYRNFHES